MAGQLRIVPSNKTNGRKLQYGGFSYTERSDSNVSIFWVCAQRSRFDCRATLKTNKDLTNPQVGYDMILIIMLGTIVELIELIGLVVG